MFGIKKYIQSKINEHIENMLESMMAITYDEKGGKMSSSFFFKVEEGHWVNIKTNQNFDVFSEHIRTQDNWENLKKNNIDRERADIDYDKEHVFKNRGNSVFDKDIVTCTDAGIFVARK